MRNGMKKGVAALAAAFMLAVPAAEACTRLVYHGHDGAVITARSMDWKDEIMTNLWIFPRGMARDGSGGPNSLTWTSKYGSVIANADFNLWIPCSENLRQERNYFAFGECHV